jgi:hypothetical protein
MSDVASPFGRGLMFGGLSFLLLGSNVISSDEPKWRLISIHAPLRGRVIRFQVLLRNDRLVPVKGDWLTSSSVLLSRTIVDDIRGMSTKLPSCGHSVAN